MTHWVDYQMRNFIDRVMKRGVYERNYMPARVGEEARYDVLVQTEVGWAIIASYNDLGLACDRAAEVGSEDVGVGLLAVVLDRVEHEIVGEFWP